MQAFHTVNIRVLCCKVWKFDWKYWYRSVVDRKKTGMYVVMRIE